MNRWILNGNHYGQDPVYLYIDYHFNTNTTVQLHVYLYHSKLVSMSYR